ncbi:helix-turn-helix domain-containing protein [Mycolicibacterium thermoresistibile]
MTDQPHEYTDEDKQNDLAALRALTRKLSRQQEALRQTAAERLEVVRRLRRLGSATYPELAAAMGLTYSAVQRLLKRLDTEGTTTPANTPHTTSSKGFTAPPDDEGDTQ